jgi:hypothetical protein
MSDPMTPEVRNWIKRTEARPPDAHHSAREVMARLPEVRQPRRWWPFPVIYRKAQPAPKTTDTTQYRPSPSPATNGHTPTATGRTQTMLSPVKAITVTALVFTIGGMMLIAQPFDRQGGNVPGAEVTDESMSPSQVSGRYIYERSQTRHSELFRSEDGVERFPGDSWAGITVESSDPRLAGEASFTLDRDIYPGRIGIVWGTGVITNEAGSWTGSTVGVIRPEDGIAWRTRDQFTGSGAYEGLSVMLDKESNGEFEGVIVPGPLPDGE